MFNIDWLKFQNFQNYDPSLPPSAQSYAFKEPLPPYAYVLTVINTPIILIPAHFILLNEMMQIADGSNSTIDFIVLSIQKQCINLKNS